MKSVAALTETVKQGAKGASAEPWLVDDSHPDPQTDALTDAELRATPVPVSGTVTAVPSGTQDVNVVSSVEVEVKNDAASAIPISAASLPLPSGAATAANQQTDALTDTQLRATPPAVKDDFANFEAQHVTLVASTDTTITFAQAVNMVRILNWDTANRVLVKNGAISSDSDATATRVGKAPTADVPGSRTLPFVTSSIHLRSAGTNEVSVEGYFRA